MHRILALLICLITLAGCATTALDPRNEAGGTPPERQGVLVGSFARDPSGPNFGSQWFYFRNVATGALHHIRSHPRFNLFTGKTPDDFVSERSNGGVFALTLPAGRYTFYNFRLFEPVGTGYRNWTSNEDYSIPFEVHAGRANYIGEIKIVTITGRNFFGRAVPAGGIWLVSDQRERDLVLLRKLHPTVATQDVVSVIPTSKERFTPLVVLPSEEQAQRIP